MSKVEHHKIIVKPYSEDPREYEYLEEYDIYYNKNTGCMFMFCDQDRNFRSTHSAFDLIERFELTEKEKVFEPNCEVFEVKVNPIDLKNEVITAKYYGNDCEYGMTMMVLNITDEMINKEIDAIDADSVSQLKMKMKDIISRIVNRYKEKNCVEEVTFSS